MIQAKKWGTTEQIYCMNNVEIHRIEIVKNGYCSKHVHEYKFNKFYVETGVLQIDVWDEGGISTTTIKTGQSTAVEPKLYHKFTALEKTVAYEIYWVQLFSEDIIRETIGGIHDPE